MDFVYTHMANKCIVLPLIMKLCLSSRLNDPFNTMITLCLYEPHSQMSQYKNERMHAW